MNSELGPDEIDRKVRKTIKYLKEMTKEEEYKENIEMMWRDNNHPSNEQCEDLLRYLEYYKDHNKKIKIIRDWFNDVKRTY